MNNQELELIKTSARLKALESLFFGYLRTNEPLELVIGNKKLLNDFFIENLEEYLKSMPDIPENYKSRRVLINLIDKEKKSFVLTI